MRLSGRSERKRSSAVTNDLADLDIGVAEEVEPLILVVAAKRLTQQVAMGALNEVLALPHRPTC
jgi:hypothetical protein